MAEAAAPDRLQRIERAFASRCCAPADDDALRVSKAMFVMAMTMIVPAGVIWGLVYLALGATQSAVMPLAYALLSLVNLALLCRTKHFGRYQVSELAFILLLPFVLQLRLGGFVPGSAVVLWALLAPLYATVFVPRQAAAWFVAFAVAVVLAGLLDSQLAVPEPLSDTARRVFFVMNLGGPSAVAILVLLSFGRSRERLRELEVAYLDQTVMLRQRDKLATLGTLAAGVAHELNNPAAAAQRAAEQLRPSLVALRQGARRLAGDGSAAADAGDEVSGSAGRISEESPLQVARREEEVEDWLAAREVDRGWEMAPLLVEAGFDCRRLEAAASDLRGPRLDGLLAVLAHGAAADELGAGIAIAARRISEIVGSLRSYSYVDRGTWQMVDITEGLESTLVLLRSKSGAMRVEREYEAGLPLLEVRGNELNQVWTNLIDNAIDATGATGLLQLRAFRAGGEVVVEVEDDGPGIPAAVVPRVFDPFFTTKEPGKGTGLGLNISHNIVVRVHGGRFEVTSVPGRTVFTVALPVARAADHEVEESRASEST